MHHDCPHCDTRQTPIPTPVVPAAQTAHEWWTAADHDRAAEIAEETERVDAATTNEARLEELSILPVSRSCREQRDNPPQVRTAQAPRRAEQRQREICNCYECQNSALASLSDGLCPTCQIFLLATDHICPNCQGDQNEGSKGSEAGVCDSDGNPIRDCHPSQTPGEVADLTAVDPLWMREAKTWAKEQDPSLAEFRGQYEHERAQ